LLVSSFIGNGWKPLKVRSMSLANDLNRKTSQNVGLVSLYRDLFARSLSLDEADTLNLSAFGVCFSLYASQTTLLHEALLSLPLECRTSFAAFDSPKYSLLHCAGSRGNVAPGYRLDRDGRPLFRCADRAEFLERFRSVIALHVAEASPVRTFVHAGVVGWGNQAILIPGRSFSGKTTLVAELVRAGATYYSDEFAVLDTRGMVYPYAQPLQIRESGSYQQTQHPVETLGGTAGTQPLPVGMVVVSKYKLGARWRPRPLTPGIGLLKLLDNTVSARRAPAIALSTLKHAVAHAAIVRGLRGEASQAVKWIAEHFDACQKHAGETE
jgi:hypothetical protein